MALPSHNLHRDARVGGAVLLPACPPSQGLQQSEPGSLFVICLHRKSSSSDVHRGGLWASSLPAFLRSGIPNFMTNSWGIPGGSLQVVIRLDRRKESRVSFADLNLPQKRHNYAAFSAGCKLALCKLVCTSSADAGLMAFEAEIGPYPVVLWAHYCLMPPGNRVQKYLTCPKAAGRRRSVSWSLLFAWRRWPDPRAWKNAFHGSVQFSCIWF